MTIQLPPPPKPVDLLQATWRGDKEWMRPVGDFFTAAQLRTAQRDAALMALEEAAKECEYRGNSFNSESPFHSECHCLAATIRALRTELENAK